MDDNNIIDADDDLHSIGADVPENFVPGDYNISFKPNRKKDPDCLLGYTLKQINTGEKLFAKRGKSYWCARVNFDPLSPKMKAACKKLYGNVDEDLI